jgi:phosphoribosylformylglycinamidine synthase subunit PurS
VYRATLIVKPKPGVRDPQGAAVEESLASLGYNGLRVESVGRVLTLELDSAREDEARQRVADMCKRLLVNPNLETYELFLTLV